MVLTDRFVGYVDKLLAHKRVVIWSWAIITFTCIVMLPMSTRMAQYALMIPEGSPSHTAFQTIKDNYPGADAFKLIEETVMVSCNKDCETVATRDAETICTSIAAKLEKITALHPGAIQNWVSYFDHNTKDDDSHTTFISPDKRHLLLTFQANVHAPIADSHQAFFTLRDYLADLEKEHPDYRVKLVGFWSQFLVSENEVLTTMVRNDVLLVPMILAVLWYMTGTFRRSMLPLLCCGVSTVCVWVAIAFVTFVFDLKLMNMTLSMVQALNFALAVDYGLFSLTRFLDERRKGNSLEEAVQGMLYFSGCTIVSSGSVLMVAWFTQTLYPSADTMFLLAHGLAACLAILFSMITNLTLSPCLIARFPQQFDMTEEERAVSPSGETPWQNAWKAWGRLCTRGPWVVVIPIVGMLVLLPVVFRLKDAKTNVNSLYQFSYEIPEYHAAREFFQAFPITNVSATSIVMKATPWKNPKGLSSLLETSGGSSFVEQQNQNVRSAEYTANELDIENQANGDAVAAAFNELAQSVRVEVGASGTISDGMVQLVAAAAEGKSDGSKPVASSSLVQQKEKVKCKDTADGLEDPSNPPDCVWLKGDHLYREGDVVQGEQFYQAGCGMIKDVVKGTKQFGESRVKPDEVLAVFYNGYTGRCVEQSRAKNYLQKQGKVGDLYRKLWQGTVSDRNNTALIMIRPSLHEPFGQKAEDFAEYLRNKVIPKWNNVEVEHKGRTFVIQTQVGSFMHTNLDSRDTIMSPYPYIMFFSIGFMFSLIALVFRSAFLPLRLLITNFIPICAVYGFSVLVYQDGIMDWTGNSHLASHGGDGLYFLVPIWTTAIIIGLALDYEIFLFARVWEYREMGYDNRSSVIKGVSETGPIITAAGTIMIIAFTGLLCGSSVMISQMGFILLISVIIDALFIRPVLVPAILCWLPELNYWPTKMPEVTRSEEDEDEKGLLNQ